jgi:hypothetical protein
MSETKPAHDSDSKIRESGEHYEASQELAIKAVAEIREFCNDPAVQ